MFLRSRFSHAYVPIFAGGYPTILRAIDPTWYVPGHPIAGHLFMLTLGFLAAVCLLKILATAFTLGSGGSGGIFAPALFIGATGGGAVGEALALFFPHLHIQPSTYALVGMGSVLAACIQAPLMAIILLFELTQNYAVMLPIMLAAVTATVVQQLLIGESIYTLALKDLGVRLGSAVGISALRRIGVEQMRLKTAPIAGPDDPLSTILSRSQQTGAGEDGHIGVGKAAAQKHVMAEHENQRHAAHARKAPAAGCGKLGRRGADHWLRRVGRTRGPDRRDWRLHR